MGKTVNNKAFGAVTVGERGQIVIPAEIRKSFRIESGDKLIIFAKTDMIGIVPAPEFNKFISYAIEMSSRLKKKLA